MTAMTSTKARPGVTGGNRPLHVDNPGYLMRGLDAMPRRGGKPEWRHNQDYWAEKDAFPLIDLLGAEFVYDGGRSGKGARPGTMLGTGIRPPTIRPMLGRPASFAVERMACLPWTTPSRADVSAASLGRPLRRQRAALRVSACVTGTNAAAAAAASPMLPSGDQA